MKKSDIVVGGLYAIQTSSKVEYWNLPVLAVAAGPFYVMGPRRHSWGTKLSSDDHAHYLSSTAAHSHGFAVLIPESETVRDADGSKFFHQLVRDGVEFTEISSMITDHVDGVAEKLLNKETLDLTRPGFAPEGWMWRVVPPKHLVGDFAENVRTIEARRAERAAKDAVHYETAAANQARLTAVQEALVELGITELGGIRFDSVPSKSEPRMSVPLSVIEALIKSTTAARSYID